MSCNKSNRRVVDFLIIGAMKCGTTSLVNILRTHPDISMPDHEGHYFDSHYGDFPLQTIEQYMSHFDYNKKCVGEKTPIYCCDKVCLDKIRSECGSNVKMIMIIRNPIDRARSHFNMTGNGNWKYWERSVLNQIQAFKQHHDINYDFPNRENYVTRGLYSIQLAQVRERFPNLLVLKLEDMMMNYSDALQKVTRYLGVSDFPPLYDISLIHSNESRVNYKVKSRKSTTVAHLALDAFYSEFDDIYNTYYQTYTNQPNKSL
jgi:Sulfotransferase domain